MRDHLAMLDTAGLDDLIFTGEPGVVGLVSG
jgi:hypothetical protein